MRQILVTTALPYANGAIHLGHLLEHIQADIWVRWQRLRGNKCTFVCADDAHGAAIMLGAEKLKISPEQLIARVQREHERDLRAFGVSFDLYYTTHSEENKKLSSAIYSSLKKNNFINSREVEQLYDPQKKMFLADRFVKGICPSCNTPDQYGDNCESCGATYTAAQLIKPYSVLSGITPETRSSRHLFFRLPEFTAFLKSWIQKTKLQTEMVNKLQEWFDSGLQEWDISRDAPYFGFTIPDEKDKYFYVWLDAPIGYAGTFAKLCARDESLKFDDYWREEKKTELYHFIGKDIVYFHTLFWPAMLHGAGWRKPSGVFVHGFLTVNGEKMSKSRGTFILAENYLKKLNAESLRYYFAAKLNSKVADIDLNLDDFVQRNNADLVGKLVNIASRCARFIKKDYANRLAAELDDEQLKLYATFVNQGLAVEQYYEKREYSRLIRCVMELADRANQYIDQQKPWLKAKEKPASLGVQQVCSLGINLFYLLILYLSPVLPQTAERSRRFLQIKEWDWHNRKALLLNHQIADFVPLIQRIPAGVVSDLVIQQP